jgi:hypothetical protein
MTTVHYRAPDGQVLIFEQPDPPRPSLDAAGVMATLNAVLGIWPVEDAANSVGLSPDDLIAEAQAWSVAMTYNEVDNGGN